MNRKTLNCFFLLISGYLFSTPGNSTSRQFETFSISQWRFELSGVDCIHDSHAQGTLETCAFPGFPYLATYRVHSPAIVVVKDRSTFFVAVNKRDDLRNPDEIIQEQYLLFSWWRIRACTVTDTFSRLCNNQVNVNAPFQHFPPARLGYSEIIPTL